MEEKMIEAKDDQPMQLKKVYTPPALTMYGKLTELTAGGTIKNWEGGGPNGNPPPDPRNRP